MRYRVQERAQDTSDPTSWAQPRGIALMMVALLVLAATGCAGRSAHETNAADSTGTIVGHLAGAFMHGGPPFYGSVVYLIPMSASTEDWWVRLAQPRYALVDPQNDRSWGYADRTTCDPAGRFQLSRA